MSDGLGLFSLPVSLIQDAKNTLLVTSTDTANNISTGSLIIIEDSTNPVTTIKTPAQTTYNSSVSLSGTTEAFAHLKIAGGSGIVSTVADD